MITSERHFHEVGSETVQSGLSWSAIFSGATAAAALSLILLVLGVGLGFSAVSPWASRGAAASNVGISAIVWLALTQLLASGCGGYLAGRLRVKWATVHTDEVYFRDTVHGFLAWAVATLTTASLLASVIGTVLSGSATIAGPALAAAGGAANVVPSSNGSNSNDALPGASAYLIDRLFRTGISVGATMPADAPLAPQANNIQMANNSSVNLEAERIFVNGLRSRELPAEDKQYLAQKIALRTGITQAEAESRVTVTFEKARVASINSDLKARQAFDTARSAAKFAALWTFITLLSAAFVASLAATFGGRGRDSVVHREPTVV